MSGADENKDDGRDEAGQFERVEAGIQRHWLGRLAAVVVMCAAFAGRAFMSTEFMGTAFVIAALIITAFMIAKVMAAILPARPALA